MEAATYPAKKNSNKIFAVIFFILVFATLAEVVYFFNSQKKETPAPTANEKPFQPSIEAINNDTLNLLKVLKKDTLVSSTLENQYQGRIVEIDKGDGRQKSYVLKIKIQSNSNFMSYAFNERELGITESVEKSKTSPSREKKIPVSDLKVGDDIMLSDFWDLTKDPAHSILRIKIAKFL